MYKQDYYVLHLQEFRQRCGVKKGLPPEHPRAGSTDHVEGILVSYTDCWDQFLMKRRCISKSHQRIHQEM